MSNSDVDANSAISSLEDVLSTLVAKESEMKELMEEVSALRNEIKDANTEAGNLMSSLGIEETQFNGMMYMRKSGIIGVKPKEPKKSGRSKKAQNTQ